MITTTCWILWIPVGPVAASPADDALDAAGRCPVDEQAVTTSTMPSKNDVSFKRTAANHLSSSRAGLGREPRPCAARSAASGWATDFEGQHTLLGGASSCNAAHRPPHGGLRLAPDRWGTGR